MKGLILKDFFSMKKQLKMYLLLILGYMVLGLYMKKPAIIGPMLCMVGSLYSVQVFTMDETCEWKILERVLPLSAGKIVLSRYLLVVPVFGAAAVLYLILNLLLPLLPAVRTQGADMGMIGVLSFGSMLLIEAVLLPLLYRFGGNSRIYILLILAVFFSLFYAGSHFGAAEALWPLVGRLPWVFLLAGAASQIPSYALSVKIYKKKEF